MTDPNSTILIVDDDADDLDALMGSLRSLGSELVPIKDPHRVLTSVQDKRPDVVLMDALLPGLSGFDLCRQIKSDPELNGIQVVIITGVYLRQQYRQEALKDFRADGFLTKPFRPPELQRLVARLLAKRTSRPQASFLQRFGLPGSSKPGKRGGFFSRFFGDGGDKPRSADASPPSPSPEVAAAGSSPLPEKITREEAKPASAPVTEAPRPKPRPEPRTTPFASPPSPPPSKAEDEQEEATSKTKRSQKASRKKLKGKRKKAKNDALKAAEKKAAADDADAPQAATEAPPRPPVAPSSESEPEPREKTREEERPAVVEAAPTDAKAETETETRADADAAEAPTPKAEIQDILDSHGSGCVVEKTEARPPERGGGAEDDATKQELEDILESHDSETQVEFKLEPEPEPDRVRPDAGESSGAPAGGESELDSPEPTAAELLSTPPPEGDDVVWREEKLAEQAPHVTPSRLDVTLPAIDIPESLKAAPSPAADPPETATEELERVLADPPTRPKETSAAEAERAEAEKAEGRADVGTEPTAPAVGEGDAEAPAPAPSPSPSRPRRIGDVPVFDEEDFRVELKRELSKCRRVDKPLTLILIKIEDLHRIMELVGKDFREHVLWHIAEAASVSLREVDLVGMLVPSDRIAMTAFASDRYGGERIVSRMAKALAKKPFRVGDVLPPIVPELLFGMATFPDDGDSVADLLDKAESNISVSD